MLSSAAMPRSDASHPPGARRHASHSLLVSSIFPVAHPRGLMVTSGGWLYCANVQGIARSAGYTLLCGKYAKDGYTSEDLRARRHLDWGNLAYLASFASEIRRVHRQVGGPLVLIGVSYSGFGVATLASHHPEIHPDRLIVVDSYLDLVARERHGTPYPIGREIDLETGRSTAALRARSVSVSGLAKLAREGTQMTFIWSVTAEENRFFFGATCARDADAETLAQLARTLHRPVPVWVTMGIHGHDLWDNATGIMNGQNPGREVLLPPSGAVPRDAYCH